LFFVSLSLSSSFSATSLILLTPNMRMEAVSYSEMLVLFIKSERCHRLEKKNVNFRIHKTSITLRHSQ
jgi:hypothetical protein